MGIPLRRSISSSLLLPLDETDTADETNSWTAMMQTGGFIIGGTFATYSLLLFSIGQSNHTYTFIILSAMYLIMSF